MPSDKSFDHPGGFRFQFGWSLCEELLLMSKELLGKKQNHWFGGMKRRRTHLAEFIKMLASELIPATATPMCSSNLCIFSEATAVSRSCKAHRSQIVLPQVDTRK